MNVIVGEGLILTRLADLGVLEQAFQLPHEMIVPDVMLADTLFKLGRYDLSAFVEMGGRLRHLDGDGVELARTYQADYPALSTSESRDRKYQERQPLVTQSCRTVDGTRSVTGGGSARISWPPDPSLSLAMSRLRA